MSSATRGQYWWAADAAHRVIWSADGGRPDRRLPELARRSNQNPELLAVLMCFLPQPGPSDGTASRIEARGPIPHQPRSSSPGLMRLVTKGMTIRSGPRPDPGIETVINTGAATVRHSARSASDRPAQQALPAMAVPCLPRPRACVRTATVGDREQSDQPELSRAADRLAAVSRRQFAVDALEVRFDRVDGDVHLAGDLGGGQHLRRVAEHFAFTFAELLDDDGRHLRGGGLASRRQAWAGQAGPEQLPVGAGQFRIPP